MKKSILYICLVILITGCRKEIGPTNIHINDPVRHYLPIIQGDELRMMYKVYNDGPNSLIIDNIQPACSAIELVSTFPALIQQGDSAVLFFHFHTDKNVNLADHTIRIFGNIIPDGQADLHFDVRIVRPSEGHSDYEEHFLHKMTEEANAQAEIRLNPYYVDGQNPELIEF